MMIQFIRIIFLPGINGDPEFSSTVLLSEEWGLTSYNWQTFSQDIDFGSGYQFLVIKIFLRVEGERQ